MQEIGINSIILKEILDGRKTVETRIAKERFLNFKVDDEISLREDVWENGEIIKSIPDQAKIIITDIQKFDTFREMFNHINYKAVLPTTSNIDEAIKSYEQYYNRDDEKKFGVIAISFQLL